MKIKPLHYALLVLLAAEACATAPATSSAQDWKLESKGEEFVATLNSTPPLTVELARSAGQPEILEWAPAPSGKNLWLLRYLSGQTGTSVRLMVERAAVIDRSSGKLLVDAAWAYKDNGGKLSKKITQPQWKWGQKELRITGLPGPERKIAYP